MTDYIEFSMHERAFRNEQFRREAMARVRGRDCPGPGRWQFVRARVPHMIRIVWTAR